MVDEQDESFQDDDYLDEDEAGNRDDSDQDIDLPSRWYSIVVENASKGQWALVYDTSNTEDGKLQGRYCSSTSASRAIITGASTAEFLEILHAVAGYR